MAIFILLAFSCLSYTDSGCIPQDCQVSSWTFWSSCHSERCGGRGVQRRTRWQDTVPSCGGSECPILEETRSCGSELTSCLNGGRLNDDGTCSCADGYSGQCCEVKPDGIVRKRFLCLHRNFKSIYLYFKFVFTLSYSFGTETITTFIHSRSSLEKSYPIPDQNGRSLYSFSVRNGAETLPFGAAHTYMYMIYRRKYPSLGYSWVARDVTKNQTKKLSILLSFYFHEALQYLNIFT